MLARGGLGDSRGDRRPSPSPGPVREWVSRKRCGSRRRRGGGQGERGRHHHDGWENREVVDEGWDPVEGGGGVDEVKAGPPKNVNNTTTPKSN